MNTTLSADIGASEVSAKQKKSLKRPLTVLHWTTFSGVFLLFMHWVTPPVIDVEHDISDALHRHLPEIREVAQEGMVVVSVESCSRLGIGACKPGSPDQPETVALITAFWKGDWDNGIQRSLTDLKSWLRKKASYLLAII